MSHAFTTFLEWIEVGLNDARDTCEKHTADEKLYRAQGECKALREIIEVNEDAPTLLSKFKPQNPTK